jgi:hypothetical protein
VERNETVSTPLSLHVITAASRVADAPNSAPGEASGIRHAKAKKTGFMNSPQHVIASRLPN